MSSNSDPIFIICTGRSGSTLLRYILDSHNEIEAPQELHLGPMIKEMTRVITLLYEDNKDDFEDYEKHILSEVRDAVEGIMEGKIQTNIWCDKSVSTIDFLDEVMQVFPNARYLFLYRDCLDFVHSALEVSKYGFQGFWFEDFILKNPENIVDGLVNFWCMQSEKRIELQKENKFKILPIKYEDLVHDTNSTLVELFDFLQLEFHPSIIDDMFNKFRVGRGDLKVQSYRRIHKNTGKGRYVPIKKIKDKTFDRMNTVLNELGYKTIEQNHNFTYEETGSSIEVHSYFKERIITHFEKALNEHIPPMEIADDVLNLDIPGLENSPWQIDFRKGLLDRSGALNKATATLKINIENIIKIIDQDLNISMAYRDGYLETDTSYQKINELGKYLFG